MKGQEWKQGLEGYIGNIRNYAIYLPALLATGLGQVQPQTRLFDAENFHKLGQKSIDGKTYELFMDKDSSGMQLMKIYADSGRQDLIGMIAAVDTERVASKLPADNGTLYFFDPAEGGGTWYLQDALDDFTIAKVKDAKSQKKAEVVPADLAQKKRVAALLENMLITFRLARSAILKNR